MSDRYIVRPCAEGKWHDAGEFNELVDTETGVVVDNDSYYDCPEDATFTRGLAFLVGRLNEQDRTIKELTK